MEYYGNLTGSAALQPAKPRLFDDDAVRPFDQRDENCGVAELGSPLIQIGFRDPTGPGAGASSKDRNVLVDNFLQSFAERRPTHRENCGHHGLAE